jgi:hypothetical protein
MIIFLILHVSMVGDVNKLNVMNDIFFTFLPSQSGVQIVPMRMWQLIIREFNLISSSVLLSTFYDAELC